GLPAYFTDAYIVLSLANRSGVTARVAALSSLVTGAALLGAGYQSRSRPERFPARYNCCRIEFAALTDTRRQSEMVDGEDTVAVTLRRRRFTLDEYHRMGEAGILGTDDRVELIEGEIIEMSPIGSRHAGTVARIHHLFSIRLLDQAVVWIQNPLL